MKKYIVLSLFAVFVTLTVSSQTPVYTQVYADNTLIKKANKWMRNGKWRNGYKDASPHESVNAVEFYQQYKKNPKQWKSLFKWLSKTNLLTISKGKHPIEGTSMVASVEDDTNGELSKRQSESHYKHIDFQFVVKGVERFGIIDHLSSTPNCEYKPDVIHYNYDVSKAKFYDSSIDKFFIFFPCDWHIAKVNNDSNDQVIRVVVIKVDYVD
jgi:biofilm protein TabA